MEERGSLVPGAIVGVILILAVLCVLFGPGCIVLYRAAQQDGFSLEAFDYGPSPLWWVGILLLVGGLVGAITIVYKVVESRRMG